RKLPGLHARGSGRLDAGKETGGIPMSPRLFLLLPALLLVPAAHAQLGGFDLNKLSKAIDTAKDAAKVAKGATGIGPEEERVMGESVAMEIIGKFGGLVCDPIIMLRVTLVGLSLARY